MKNARLIEVYEVQSPSFPDLGLDAQISHGINDWLAIDAAGREFFGRSKSEAVSSLRTFNLGAAQ